MTERTWPVDPNLKPVPDVYSVRGLAGYTQGKDEDIEDVAEKPAQKPKGKHQLPKQAREGLGMSVSGVAE